MRKLLTLMLAIPVAGGCTDKRETDDTDTVADEDFMESGDSEESDIANDNDTGNGSADDTADGSVPNTDDTGGPTSFDYSFGEPVIEGTLANVGDSVTVTFETFNQMGEMDCAYPTVLLTTESTWVEINPTDAIFFCADPDEPLSTPFTITMTESVDAGTLANFQMRVSRLNCEAADSMTDCPTYEEAGFDVPAGSP